MYHSENEDELSDTASEESDWDAESSSESDFIEED